MPLARGHWSDSSKVPRERLDTPCAPRSETLVGLSGRARDHAQHRQAS